MPDAWRPGLAGRPERSRYATLDIYRPDAHAPRRPRRRRRPRWVRVRAPRCVCDIRACIPRANLSARSHTSSERELAAAWAVAAPAGPGFDPAVHDIPFSTRKVLGAAVVRRFSRPSCGSEMGSEFWFPIVHVQHPAVIVQMMLRLPRLGMRRREEARRNDHALALAEDCGHRRVAAFARKGILL